MPDHKLNLLARAVDFAASAFPRWHAQRLEWRAYAGQAAQQRFEASSRGGAIATRLGKAWTDRYNTPTSQSIAEGFDLRSMRDRADEVDRENPIGHGMLNRIVDNVVGDGFTLQMRSKSKAWNREVEDGWLRFWEAPDITGQLTGPDLEALTYREHERAGDVGWLMAGRGRDFRVQLIASRQIATPDDKHLSGNQSPRIIEGVEVTPDLRPVAFHILDQDDYGKRSFSRVPAENFIFLPRLKRINQVRGETCFAQVFPLLDQIDGYVDAVVVAARMGAMFGLIFRKTNVGPTLSALGTTTNSQGDPQRVLTVENGIVSYIGTKDEVAQVQAQQPMQQTPDFIRAMLRLIGLPFDMPLELVLMDFSEPNFAAAKANLLQFYRAMTPRQNRFKTKGHSPLFRRWLSEQIRAGVFTTKPPADADRHEFLAHEWTWVDPIEQVQAALLEMDGGLNSRPRLIKKLGRDPEEITGEQEADVKDRKKRGLAIQHSNLSRSPETGADKQDKPNAAANAA